MNLMKHTKLSTIALVKYCILRKKSKWVTRFKNSEKQLEHKKMTYNFWPIGGA